MYNIQYAEFNTRFCYCHNCGFNGEVFVNENNMWECPNCGNKGTNKKAIVFLTIAFNLVEF